MPTMEEKCGIPVEVKRYCYGRSLEETTTTTTVCVSKINDTAMVCVSKINDTAMVCVSGRSMTPLWYVRQGDK